MTASKERFSVTFTPRSVEAIQEAMDLTQESQPDTINHAVRVYAFIEKQRAEGKELVIRGKDGHLEPIHIL
jgi:hypothetical protein